MNRVTRALSPYYHATCDFVVAPDARIWVMKDGWPVKATLADVVVGDRVYAQGGADRSMPSAPVFTIRWMVVRHAHGGGRDALTEPAAGSDGPGGAVAPPGPSSLLVLRLLERLGEVVVLQVEHLGDAPRRRRGASARGARARSSCSATASAASLRGQRLRQLLRVALRQAVLGVTDERAGAGADEPRTGWR